MIDAQEVESDIQPSRLSLCDHRIRKLHHVVIDSDCYVATCCVAIREVPVLVGQYSAEPVLLEIVKNTDSQDEYSLRLILWALSQSSFLVNCKVSPWRNSDFVHWSCVDRSRHGASQIP